MPLIGAIGNPQAASFGQMPHRQAAPQVQVPQPYVQSNLQQRFQSISGRHFQETSSLVSKVMQMQNQHQGLQVAQQHSMVLSAAQSSGLAVNLNDGSPKKRKASPVGQSHMDIQDYKDDGRQTEKDRRSMYNSIDMQGLESMKAGKTERDGQQPRHDLRPTYSLRRSEIDFL